MEVVILNEAKMNSLEIAQLVKTEHRNVKVSIERLMKSGVIRCASMTNSEKINNLGFSQKYSYYEFSGNQGKRDSLVVVAQLSPKFIGALVDRWLELEEKIERLEKAEPKPLIDQDELYKLRKRKLLVDKEKLSIESDLIDLEIEKLNSQQSHAVLETHQQKNLLDRERI